MKRRPFRLLRRHGSGAIASGCVAFRGRSILLLASSLFFATPARAQEPLQASSLIEVSKWTGASSPIAIQLSRPALPGEGRVAVLIADTDWSALTEMAGDRVVVRPGALLFPAGEHQVAIFLVAPGNQWSEIGRFAIKVLTPEGFELADVTPAFELSNKGQIAYGRTPQSTPTQRGRYQDFNFTGGLQTRTAKNGWTTEAHANVVGVTLKTERLRFATAGTDAPSVDLASYLASTGTSNAKVSLGHVTIVGQRYLAQQFASRGAQAWFKPAQAVDFTLSITNGSSIVGWANPLGFGDADHQLRAATIGLELRPSRPGDVRLSGSLVDGSTLPVAGYTQGVVNDWERSRGVALELAAKDAAQRLRIDAGFARSRFNNPIDPLLNGGFAIIPVRESTRDARYFDASFDVVHDLPLGASQQRATIAAAYRFEQVDPLFRTVGAVTRSDTLQHALEMNGRIGQVATQLSYTWLHDNLDAIASVLTTRSRALAANVAVPFASFKPGLGDRAQWVPTATYTLTRAHQFADGVPANSDFDSASQIPDQMNTVHTLAIEWQGLKVRGGYRYNVSVQDNRQVGRALADFTALNNAITIALTPHARFDVAGDVAFEGQENKEVVRNDLTRRIGVVVNWRPWQPTTITSTVIRTGMSDRPRTTERNVTDFTVQFSQRIPLVRPERQSPGLGFFARVARQTLFALEPVFGVSTAESFWSANTGFTMRLF